jgi:hypothetical protein
MRSSKTEQKFRRGDVVRIFKDLGPSMSHFESGVDAIVMGSYADQYGGDDARSYTLMLMPEGNEVSWYYEHQLTLVRHGGEELIKQTTADRELREILYSDLDWIIENWKRLKAEKSIPGATVGKLMELVGITNPLGSQGEGFVYYINATATVSALDEALASGDKKAVMWRIEEVRKLKPHDSERGGDGR